jgi:hypothetical protein
VVVTKPELETVLATPVLQIISLKISVKLNMHYIFTGEVFGNLFCFTINFRMHNSNANQIYTHVHTKHKIFELSTHKWLQIIND